MRGSHACGDTSRVPFAHSIEYCGDIKVEIIHHRTRHPICDRVAALPPRWRRAGTRDMGFCFVFRATNQRVPATGYPVHVSEISPIGARRRIVVDRSRDGADASRVHRESRGSRIWPQVWYAFERRLFLETHDPSGTRTAHRSAGDGHSPPFSLLISDGSTRT